MYDNEIKELKKFVQPSPAISIVGTVFALIAIFILLIAVTGSSYDKSDMIITGVVGLIVGIGLAVYGIYLFKRANKKLAEIDSNGGTQILLNDFRTGGKAFKDLLILGQTFLMGKHTGTVITYNEITQIYQYVHKTNYIEDSRILRVVLAPNGKTVDLCRIPLRGKGDDEVLQVINFILSKNPNIKVGYN